MNTSAQATIITDLSFGDTGKGTTVEYLAAQSPSAVVVRFNGGGQAEHNVITEDGRHHTFSQFGSASFLSTAVTHLSQDMWVNPLTMFPEAAHLIELGVTDIWQRTTVSGRARIVTPFHQAANRLRELARNKDAHGSTGQGIGEAVLTDMLQPQLTLRAEELSGIKVHEKLEALRKYKRDQMRALGALLAYDSPDWQALNDPSLSDYYAECYAAWSKKIHVVAPDYLQELAYEHQHLVFEAAQGVLLDERHGFHPYTTWSTTTPANALQLLSDISFSGKVRTLGILRAYTTRHGPGPFVTEDPALDDVLPEYFNGTGRWQGKFRIGHFDSLAHRYAIKAAGHIDGLVVTGLDRITALPEWKFATGYQLPLVPPSDPLTNTATKHAMRIVSDIAFDRWQSLSAKEQLTTELLHATPIYDSLENPSSEQVLAQIEQLLGLPVLLSSYGPTLADKVPHQSTQPATNLMASSCA